ncbi:FAD-dependent monooxygenase [Nonomuraea sp. NPDC049646]|uniref:aromatic-ring hydroxylase C-terminal domain-containing protein n=1 Tax=unclassified Nonomuraea TaxID=2593643 RepID=UPI0037A472A4
MKNESTEYDDDVPMTVPELQDSIHRVVGARLPVAQASRLSRFTFKARQAERYRQGRILLAGAFAPDLTLHTDQGVTSVAELLHTARPVLLHLAGRPELRAVAAQWRDRVDVRIARTGERPADALLIRPDAHIAWAAGLDESADSATPALREALSAWFGTPSTQEEA